MLQNLGRDDVVEAVLGEWEIPGVGLHDRKRCGGRGLAGLCHSLEDGRRTEQVLARQIGAGDVSAASEGLEGVPAWPRAKVEEPGAPPDAEPVEVDGQQPEAMTSR